MLTVSLSPHTCAAESDTYAWWDVILYPSTDKTSESAPNPTPPPAPSEKTEEIPFYSHLLDSIIYLKLGKRTKQS